MRLPLWRWKLWRVREKRRMDEEGLQLYLEDLEADESAEEGEEEDAEEH